MTPFRLIQIIGARPQIIKSAALSRAVENGFSDSIQLITLHTGQHYDEGMSAVFFQELGIREPDIQLTCKGGTHAEQTACIMRDCEAQFNLELPDAVLVYGDTNSTLAAALSAYKMNIPVFHVEAGLRSHNLSMPEECNRIATDHLSTLLFCPTEQAIAELANEGLSAHTRHPSLDSPGILSCGDVMYDNSSYYASLVAAEKDGGQQKGEIILATCHRPSNTDDPRVFERILETLASIGKEGAPVVLPLHPRVRRHEALIERFTKAKGLEMIEPVSFLEMIRLLKRSKAVITDSGGLQKEAFFLQRPCVVLRNETEWTELVANGNSILAGNDPARINKALTDILGREHNYPSYYGNADAAEQICEAIKNYAASC